MSIVDKDKICCMHCCYWHGCPVIVKNETGFSCSSCYCKLFEVNDKPTLNDKLKANDWIIPDIIHLD